MRLCILIPLLLLLSGQMLGCAVTVPYGVYEDKRLTETIVDDKTISTGIKTALLDANFGKGWQTSVYTYYGNVFLVGDLKPEDQPKAVEIANKAKGVRSITTHWFTPRKSEDSDFVIRTKLRANLINAKGVSNTRIDTEVNAGRVVLLGVVENQAEIDRVIKAAKETSGVKEVKSYLMLPLK